MKLLCAPIGILALIIFLAPGAAAQPAGGGFGRGRMMTELGLSSEQTEALACDEPGQGMQYRMEYESQRKVLNDLLRNRSTSDDVVKEQLEKVNSGFAAWNRFRLERMLKARSVLNDEQLDKLLKMQEEGGGYHRGRGRWAAQAE